MALSKTMVLKIYTSVMEDVIAGVKEIFADEGVDEHVLQELKGLWESKLLASKAVETQSDSDKVKKVEIPVSNVPVYSQPMKTQQIVKQPQTMPMQQVVTTQQVQIQEDKMIPVQMTLPAQPNVDMGPRVLTIQVPASALNAGQLHSLLAGPVISAAMGLPAPLASALLQQHINAALQSQQQPQMTTIKTVMPQTDGPSTSGLQRKRAKVQTKKDRRPIIEFIQSLDGGIDSSDDDEDEVSDNVSEEDIEEEEDKEDEEPELDDHAAEEEPLNSEDDVTDEEPTDLFVTDNVVVCQYDKITRSRNKWKFYLKDGIMNLEGEDYVFHKANGDAEW